MVISWNCLRKFNAIEKKGKMIFFAIPTERQEKMRMMIDSRYRIVLADDHAPFRQGLKSVLIKEGDLEVVGEAADGLDLLTFLSSAKLAPHMAIVDISMPNLGGLEATSKIKAAHPDMKVLILSMHQEKEYVEKALSVGADGYLLKQDSSNELFSAIEKIRQGGVYLSPLLNDNKIGRF
jgi:DNA-binding NarL/FixJ family response regulator